MSLKTLNDFKFQVRLHELQAEVFNDPHRFKVVVAGRRWGKCLADGTLIAMTDGTEKPIESVCPGDWVLTINENTYRMESKRVVAVANNGIREVLRVSTSSRSVVCTPNHPILANNTWIDAGNLSLGDLVAVPRKTVFGSLRVDPLDLRSQLNSWRKQMPSRVSVRRYENVKHYTDGHFDPISDGDVVWEEVRSIEPHAEVQTWDLQVEDNHNFVSNGIVTHNSRLARVTMILRAAEKQRQNVWYIAPNYRMTKSIMWEDLLDAIPPAWIDHIHHSDLRIRLRNGSKITCLSADNPNSLRGNEVNYLVLDEYQDMKADTWNRVLRPTLAKSRGHAMFIGCVRGDTRVLPKSGSTIIKSFCTNEQSFTLESINLPLYGLDREFHTADGYWNNGVAETKKITTHSGFSIEATHRHPLLVMDECGLYEWRRSDEIREGDRVAIARGMEVWGDNDPLAGFQDHIGKWREDRKWRD